MQCNKPSSYFPSKLTYSLDIFVPAVIATGVIVARTALAAAQAEGTRLASVCIDRLEVDFPSLSSPVSIRIRGVRVYLQQLQLPEVRQIRYFEAL